MKENHQRCLRPVHTGAVCHTVTVWRGCNTWEVNASTHRCGLIRCCLTVCGQMRLVECERARPHGVYEIKTKFTVFFKTIIHTTYLVKTTSRTHILPHQYVKLGPRVVYKTARRPRGRLHQCAQAFMLNLDRNSHVEVKPMVAIV